MMKNQNDLTLGINKWRSTVYKGKNVKIWSRNEHMTLYILMNVKIVGGREANVYVR